jgi:sirohydrochlorin cobaltochelatase
MMRAVIVFAHGSRDPLWRQPVQAVAQAIAARDPSCAVRCAYLELCEPTLAQAVDELVAQGATDIRVLPLFFGMGKHAREDLPALMRDLQARHPHARLQRLPTAGEDPRLIALLADIALEGPVP